MKLKMQVIELIGCDEDEIIYASAKSGIGINEIFSAIIERIESPKDQSKNDTQSLNL